MALKVNDDTDSAYCGLLTRCDMIVMENDLEDEEEDIEQYHEVPDKVNGSTSVRYIHILYITLAHNITSHVDIHFKCSITLAMRVRIILIFTSTNNEEGSPHIVILTNISTNCTAFLEAYLH